MSRTIKISPSLLAADPLNFAKEVKEVEAAGADFHHVDVMDGHFVPNLTYGIPFVAALKQVAKIPLDVHIMVSNPDEVAAEYVKAGADILVFHIEASKHPHRLAQQIRSLGAKAGVAINPGTSLEQLRALVHEIDVINVMSVNPGFSGQKFIENAVKRVAALNAMLKEEGRRQQVMIEVDGGINADTGKAVVAAGADLLVAGNYVFKSASYKKAITDLRG